MRLEPDQIDFYWTNGYLPLPNLFPADHVQTLLARLEALCADWQGEEAQRMGIMQEPEAAEKTPATVRKFAGMAEVDPLFLSHVCHPNLLDVVAQLLGTPLSLYADQALLKPPYHGSEKPEHQDNAYFKVAPADHLVTCWTALDDSDLANGCMHYYAGSHKGGVVAHRAIPNTPHLVPEGFDRTQSSAVPIRAGGCILHHSETVHWSPPNHSPRWRRAVVCHLVRSDATMGQRRPDSPPLVTVRA
jgi:ectoine hydroxylase-related dioxygenase (phytanoyl-CoA dioxygenase family)